MKKIYTLIFLAAVVLALCPQLWAGDIVILGDSQDKEDVQLKIVGAIRQCKPSVIFRVGDIVNDGNDINQWRRFRAINAPLLSTAEYFPALGNHEFDSPLYFKEFPAIEGKRWYSVDREGIHFIVLDSNSDMKAGSEQYEWLVSDLGRAAKTEKYIIAIFHHPLFNVGMHDEDEKKLQPILLPLFERYGVSAVFSGHDHNYERFIYHDIDFVVTAGGGSYLINSRRTNPYLIKFVKDYNFCLLSPGADSVKVKVLNADSQVIDEFEISPAEADVSAGHIWNKPYWLPYDIQRKTRAGR